MKMANSTTNNSIPPDVKKGYLYPPRVKTALPMGGPIAIPRPAADSAREVIRPAYEGASDVRRGIPVAQTILAPIPIRIRDRKHILTNQTPPKNKSQRQNKK